MMGKLLKMMGKWEKMLQIFAFVCAACTVSGCTLIWANYLDDVKNGIEHDGKHLREFTKERTIAVGLYAGRVVKDGNTFHHIQFDQLLEKPKEKKRYLDIYIPEIQSAEEKQAEAYLTESENRVAGRECACIVFNLPSSYLQNYIYENCNPLFTEGPEYVFVSSFYTFPAEEPFNSGRVIQNLKETFRDFGSELSDNAYARVVEKGRRWIIQDQNVRYIMKKAKLFKSSATEDILVYKSVSLESLSSAFILYCCISWQSEATIYWKFYERNTKQSWDIHDVSLSTGKLDIEYVKRSKIGLSLRNFFWNAGHSAYLITVPLDLALSPLWMTFWMMYGNAH